MQIFKFSSLGRGMVKVQETLHLEHLQGSLSAEFCSIDSSPACTYSPSPSWFQATSMMSLDAELGKDVHGLLRS